MKEYPILFSGPMVRAILEGRKTMTRRVIRPLGDHSYWSGNCPYGQPGDRLWVQETWWTNGENKSIESCAYRARDKSPDHMLGEKWHPSIHMPRWASRLTLENISVRVERVQDISEEDARAEGVDPIVDALGNIYAQDGYSIGYRLAFTDLWDSINAKRGYSCESNPSVWVVEFKPLGHGEGR